MSLKEKNSFALIEILTVMAIVAILFSAVLLYTKSTKEDAKVASALQFRNSISNVLGAYNVGAWKFEGATINESGYDNSGYKNNCTPSSITGNISYISSAHNSLGKALRINNRYLNCGDSASRPNLFSSSTITMEAWAKSENLNNNTERGIVTNKLNNNYGINLFMNNVYIGSRIGRSNANTLVTTNWAPSANTWYHIVITYNSKNKKAILYVNGKIEKEETITSGDLSYSADNNYFGVGCHRKTRLTGGCTGYFIGAIDEVKVYNESLVFAQVREHYAEGLKRLELAGLK